MKKIPSDPLRNQPGTLQLHYQAIMPRGLCIEVHTRTFRMSTAQYERLEAFVKELYEGTPELQPVVPAEAQTP